MLHRKDSWLDEEIRKQKYLRSEREDAFFGFEEIPAWKKAEKVRRHFDSVASVYDFMNTVLSFGIHRLWKKTAVDRMGLAPGQRVLDVCGGTGDLAWLAARKTGRSGEVVIFDINWAMMAAGRSRAEGAPCRGSVSWCQGDAERIPFADGSFDAAMVGFGIRNVTHPERGFAEMHRVLRPGGVFMCLEFSRPHNPVFRKLYDLYSFTAMPVLGDLLAGSSKAYSHLSESIRTWAMPEEISGMLERVGFAGISFRRLTNGIAVAHTARKP